MLSFEQILQRIEKEVNSISMDYEPSTLYDPIRYILSLGGKRIRPALALLACNIYNDNITSIIKPALGLEVFHNFTLLHDDLMDGADKRRHQPTVHKKWNTNTAILSGDAMLILAYKLMGETEPVYLKSFLNLFTKTALEICGGQQYDMEFESRLDVSEEEYINMIRLKTAVLLACGLKMGGIAGGASMKDAAHLYEYGINVGLAFQLKDDLLDTFGDTATFGKNIGGDILSNKKTFLLIQALTTASDKQKKVLIEWINKKEFDPAEKINTFKALYEELHIKEICENKITHYYLEAEKQLATLTIEKNRLGILQDVCNKLMYRNS